MNLSNRLEKISSHPDFLDRTVQAVSELGEGKEPCFFAKTDGPNKLTFSKVYSEEGEVIKSPMVYMLNFLFPEMDEADFDRIGSGEGTRTEMMRTETELRKIIMMTHFQFRNILHPSENDLSLFNMLYHQYTASHAYPPLQIIGRVNERINLLAINQIRAIDEAKFDEVPSRITQRLVALELPRYLRRNGLAKEDLTEVKRCAETIRLMSFEDWTAGRGRDAIERLPGQDIIEKFRAEVRADITHFRSYATAVSEGLEHMGAVYEAATKTLPRESNF